VAVYALEFQTHHLYDRLQLETNTLMTKGLKVLQKTDGFNNQSIR